MLQAATVSSRHRSVLAETCMVEGERAGFRENWQALGWPQLLCSSGSSASAFYCESGRGGVRLGAWSPGGIASSSVSEEKWKIESAE